MTTFLNWEFLYATGAALLGLGIAWGMWSYYSRDKRNDPVTEAATRAEYDHPDSYEDTIKPGLDRQVR